MTQVSDIVTDAFRESNLIALNSTPSPAEMTEGLARLNSIVRSTLGNDVGYIMEDWKVVSNSSIYNPSNVVLSADQAVSYYVRPQSRLMAALTSPSNFALDPMPQDGQRVSVIDAIGSLGLYSLELDGNGRRIAGGATVVISDADARRDFFYRSDLGEWVEIIELTTTDELPFPEDFDDYFITKLAMRINPRYGRPLPAETAMRFAEQKQQIIDRYSQSRVRGAGIQKLADQANIQTG